MRTETLMVRSRALRGVSNHEALGFILRDASLRAAPLDEDWDPHGPRTTRRDQRAIAL